MEEEEACEYYEINLGDGQTVYFAVRPDETMRDFRDRLQATEGITMDISGVTNDGKNFDENTNVLSYLSTAFQNGAPGSEQDAGPGEIVAAVEVEPEPVESTAGDVASAAGGAPNSAESGDPLATMFCSVPGCPSNKIDDPNLPLFRFPAQKRRCMAWVTAIGRHDLARESIGFLSTQVVVCANHFAPEQFSSKEHRSLRQTAVPSLKLIKEEASDSEALLEGQDEGEVDLDATLNSAPKTESDPELDFGEDINLMNLDAELDLEPAESVDSHPGWLCRLCACILDGAPAFLFDEVEGEPGLGALINECLPVSVTATDVLPKQICQACALRLKAQHAFAQACLQAETKLIALTGRFMVNGLKKLGCASLRRRGHTKQSHACPLCCTGGMRYTTKDQKGRPPSSGDVAAAAPALDPGEVVKEEGDDPMAGLYSDEGESDSEQREAKEEGRDVFPADGRTWAYECDVCEEAFADASSCLAHCKSHQAHEFFPCTVCGLVLGDEEQLDRHFGQHSVKAPTKKPWKTVLKCGTCGEQASTKKNFILHKCSNPVLEVSTIDTAAALVCATCARTFTSVGMVLAHKNTHQRNAKLLTCAHCGLSAAAKQILEHHIAVVHEGARLRCGECGLTFLTVHHKERHSLVHTEPHYQYQCSLCQSMFATLAAIQKHVDMHNQEEQVEVDPLELVCPKCTQPFTQRSHLQHHLETAHDSMGRMPSLIQYQCNVCSERIRSSAEVLVHRTLHWKSTDPDLPYVCEYCGEAHPSPNALARHRRYLHPDEHPYVCTLCDAATRTLYEARVHRKTHTGYVSAPHKTQPKIFQCEQCPSLFSDKASFVAHKKTHKQPKWFECDRCEKAFPERHRLIVHKRLHTGEKPYACGTCGKRFAQTSAMYTHALLHTGETPHSCDLCQRRFRIKSDRDSHRRTHTGEKPFKCQHCDKSFRTGQVYYQHRMIHTGERRYPCDVCGRAFKRSHTLACHKRIHTGEKPNVCDVCGKGFRQRTDMRKHKMNLHNIAA